MGENPEGKQAATEQGANRIPEGSQAVLAPGAAREAAPGPADPDPQVEGEEAAPEVAAV